MRLCEREVLPQLFERRASNRWLTIWSAACSTGQEPYSVAILLREHFADYLDWNIRLLGRISSRTALQQAVEGRYSELEVTRGLSPVLRDKYFERRGDSWVVNQEVRAMIEFRPLNLASPVAHSSADGHRVIAERDGLLRYCHEEAGAAATARS